MRVSGDAYVELMGAPRYYQLVDYAMTLAGPVDGTSFQYRGTRGYSYDLVEVLYFNTVTDQWCLGRDPRWGQHVPYACAAAGVSECPAESMTTIGGNSSAGSRPVSLVCTDYNYVNPNLSLQCTTGSEGRFFCGAMAVSALLWFAIKLYNLRETTQTERLCVCSCIPSLAKKFEKQISGAGCNFLFTLLTSVAYYPSAEYDMGGYGSYTFATGHFATKLPWIKHAFSFTVCIVTLEAALWVPVWMCLCRTTSMRCFVRVFIFQIILTVVFASITQILESPATLETANSYMSGRSSAASGSTPSPTSSLSVGDMLSNFLRGISLVVPSPGDLVPMVLLGVIGPAQFIVEQTSYILDDKLPILGLSLCGLGKKLRIKLGADENWDPADSELEDEPRSPNRAAAGADGRLTQMTSMQLTDPTLFGRV